VSRDDPWYRAPAWQKAAAVFLLVLCSGLLAFGGAVCVGTLAGTVAGSAVRAYHKTLEVWR
jgi:hypothetical protein